MEAQRSNDVLRPVQNSRGFCVLDLGVSDYAVVYEMQKELVEKLKGDSAAFDYLILVEHPEVYTYGRRSLVAGEIPLAEANVYSFSVERGGEATFHNPGQLVGYPIMKLEGTERDLHAYLRKMEGLLVDVLSEFGIASERREKATGVWVTGGQRKIASIGVAVSNWVTYHGFALNVNNELSGFSKIRPCGFESSVMTSMNRELGEDQCPALERVKCVIMEKFGDCFGRRMVV